MVTVRLRSFYDSVAQLVERLPVKHLVVGSNPTVVASPLGYSPFLPKGRGNEIYGLIKFFDM